MLCHTCSGMLRMQNGKQWRGTYDLHFDHHKLLRDLFCSKEMNCGICRVLFEELENKHGSRLDDVEMDDTRTVNIRAFLFIPNPREDPLYCLTFKFCYGQIQCQRAFVLRETDSIDPPPFRTPTSSTTDSDEVLQRTIQWMAKCRCVERDGPPSYPTRLINLRQLKQPRFLYGTSLEASVRGTGVEVQLEETCDWEDERPTEYARYVTLSHCWGNLPHAERVKLSSENVEEFKRGIRLNSLPTSFRHAMLFAARLPEVGYIWIDSLCIKQGDVTDWLEQSARMGEIYKNAYLNLSATAAINSEQGLFTERSPETLIEDEVILNIAGIPGATSVPSSPWRPSQNVKKSVLQILGAFWPIRWLMRYLPRRMYMQAMTLPIVKNQSTNARLGSKGFLTIQSSRQPPHNWLDAGISQDIKGKDLRRCIILDLSFWEYRVDKAPVNKRGWVLQERLMAPRVLHFCRDQVAWECREFEAAEGQPVGMPNYQLTMGGIRAGSRLKGLNPQKDGRWLRNMRLQGYKDPDPELPGIYAFELWRRIVEEYSKTAVTNPGDKLIALSGMARFMSQQIEMAPEAADVRNIGTTGSGKSQRELPKCTQYVAGLWVLYLASQLLWYVEPTFRRVDGGKLEHLTTAPSDYRAPSFSWAAIDAHDGNGITYGEVTDKEILITVVKASVTPRLPSDEYGMLEGAYIILHAKLRKANLFRKGKDRFGWCLVGREKLDEDEHTDVYLDCPARDGTGLDNEGILRRDAGVFVVPAAHTDRKASPKSKYLTCLILRLDKTRPAGPVFHRIGLTKLSPYGDHRALDDNEILKPYDSDVNMVKDVEYNPKTGMHRICLV